MEGNNFFYVYVLLSGKDGKFYIGFTHNLEGRFEEHKSGRVESTKDRRPFNLVYFEGSLNKKDALKRERYFKTFHGKMFWRRRLKSYLTG